MVDRFCLRVVVSAIAFEFAHSILYRMHSREVGSRGRPFGSTAFSIRGSVRISYAEGRGTSFFARKCGRPRGCRARVVLEASARVQGVCSVCRFLDVSRRAQYAHGQKSVQGLPLSCRSALALFVWPCEVRARFSPYHARGSSATVARGLSHFGVFAFSFCDGDVCSALMSDA